MEKIILIPALLIAISLTGCFSDKTTEETKSIEWYIKHKNELASKIKECADNPGELMKTSNCINAKSAYLQSSLGTR